MKEKFSLGGSPEKNKKLVRAGGSDRYPRYEFVAEPEGDAVQEEATSLESEISPELSKPQRKVLRSTLLALGIALTPMKDSNHSEAAFEDGYKVPDGGAEVLDNRRSKIRDSIDTTKQKTNLTEGLGAPDPVVDVFGAEVQRFVKGIDDVDVARTLEYAQKPVVGAPDFSRIEYIQEAIQFAPWDEEKETGVPPVVADELRRLLPGLGAQESRFDASRVSRSGARGIMQFMPKTWESYGGRPEEITSLKRQVEIAGLFISDLYRQLRTHMGEETLRILESRFASEEDFLRQAMVPFVLNSYNAGAKRMADAINLYVQTTPVAEMPSGQDLYIAIADFAEASDDGFLAGYNKEAREYVPKIYAQVARLFPSEQDNPQDS